jgi:N-acetylglucosamine-6-phosphate deacetylase
LEPGRRADVVVLDADLRVAGVVVGGADQPVSRVSAP